MNRRRFLQTLGIAGASLAVPGLVDASPRRQAHVSAGRIGFLTDVHLPATGMNDKVAQALDTVQGQNCDLIVFGGDNIFNGGGKVTLAEAEDQFANWQKVISQRVSLPHYSCLGNHDVVGPVTRDQGDLHVTKYAAMKAYGMAERFSTFKRGEWRVILLDSIQAGSNGYVGEIDAPQLAWLEHLIKTDDSPTIVFSHVPILSIAPYMAREASVSPAGIRMPFTRVLANGRDLVNLFATKTNVKLALSGHLHMVDKIRYKGTSYQCAGAVCGGWWKGSYEGFAPTASVVDLRTDGTTKVQFFKLA